MVGIICGAGRFVGLANAAYFISDPVLIGFKTGAALYIASTQLPKLFGVEGVTGNFFERVSHIVVSLPESHVPSLLFGLAAIVLFMVFERLLPGRPTTLIVVVAAIAVMTVFGLSEVGIKIVGDLPSGLPEISLPNIHAADISALIPVALALFALGVAIYHLLMARALSVRFNRGMVQIFVTFGLAILLRGAAQFTFGSDFKSVSTSLLAGRTIDLAGVFIPMPQLAAGIVSLLAFGLLLLISRTEFGRALEATREDREAVALIGIDRDRIFALGWGLGAAAVGIAGVMLATFYYVSPSVGANFALIAYVTVALGGFGSLFGALVAGLLIGQVEALTAFLIEPSLKQVGMFAIYLAVLMFRPRGLFGTL